MAGGVWNTNWNEPWSQVAMAGGMNPVQGVQDPNAAANPTPWSGALAGPQGNAMPNPTQVGGSSVPGDPTSNMPYLAGLLNHYLPNRGNTLLDMLLKGQSLRTPLRMAALQGKYSPVNPNLMLADPTYGTMPAQVQTPGALGAGQGPVLPPAATPAYAQPPTPTYYDARGGQ